jgi:hypothetical protein
MIRIMDLGKSLEENLENLQSGDALSYIPARYSQQVLLSSFFLVLVVFSRIWHYPPDRGGPCLKRQSTIVVAPTRASLATVWGTIVMLMTEKAP